MHNIDRMPDLVDTILQPITTSSRTHRSLPPSLFSSNSHSPDLLAPTRGENLWKSVSARDLGIPMEDLRKKRQFNSSGNLAVQNANFRKGREHLKSSGLLNVIDEVGRPLLSEHEASLDTIDPVETCLHREMTPVVGDDNEFLGLVKNEPEVDVINFSREPVNNSV